MNISLPLMQKLKHSETQQEEKEFSNFIITPSVENDTQRSPPILVQKEQSPLEKVRQEVSFIDLDMRMALNKQRLNEFKQTLDQSIYTD